MLSLIKRILYWPPVNIFFRIVNKFILSLFYEPKYLKGKYFDQKIMGWLWAWQDLPFKLMGFNKKVPWPMTPFSRMHNSNNIIFDPDSINIFQAPGCYFQNHNAKIIIGKGVYIAPNVGIITSNHNLDDLDIHEVGRDVVIGDQCWIGMNSVILPGVILGSNTIVGAGAVVTKSFPEGHCIVAGVPAKVIKKLHSNHEEKRDLNIK